MKTIVWLHSIGSRIHTNNEINKGKQDEKDTYDC